MLSLPCCFSNIMYSLIRWFSYITLQWLSVKNNNNIYSGSKQLFHSRSINDRHLKLNAFCFSFTCTDWHRQRSSAQAKPWCLHKSHEPCSPWTSQVLTLFDSCMFSPEVIFGFYYKGYFTHCPHFATTLLAISWVNSSTVQLAVV